MRFLHPSDWHPFRIYHGRFLTDAPAVVLSQIRNILRRESPEFMVIVTNDTLNDRRSQYERAKSGFSNRLMG